MSLINNKMVTTDINRFSHYAMATVFEILIDSDEKEYAEQAAKAAFDEIDRLEKELSRFIPISEVARINSLKIGEKLNLSWNTFECLVKTQDIFNITNGLFDISAGHIIDNWKNNLNKSIYDNRNLDLKNIGMDKIIIDKDNHLISVLSDDLLIDFGGFGKGYAIDVLSELLFDWEIENALVHSGGSTVKAIGKLSGHEGWPISISNPSSSNQTIAEVLLKDFSISGSGKQKGTHIINPKTNQPVKNVAGAWAMAKSAAQSDAMSTAFMIMPVEEMDEFCKIHSSNAGIIILKDTLNVSKEDVLISNNFRPNKLFI